MSVNKIEEIVKQFINSMPGDLKKLPEDAKRIIKEHLASTLQKMDIVTRDEFEVQKAVLMRTREKLEKLEKKLQQLDQQ